MEKPNSPGTGQVDLRNCIDQLLKFVLESHVDETLELDLGLTRDYCCNLLREDCPDQGGVPPSPSYKRLALFLHEIITCTKLCGTDREAWGEMLADKGSQLVDVFKAINFELHVQEPFFTQLKDGLKTIEGRCATGNYKRIATGALVLFNKCLVLEVEDVHSYNSFSEMLIAEGLQNVLPGVKTTEEGGKLALLIGVYLPLPSFIRIISSKARLYSLMGMVQQAIICAYVPTEPRVYIYFGAIVIVTQEFEL